MILEKNVEDESCLLRLGQRMDDEDDFRAQRFALQFCISNNPQPTASFS